MTANTATTNAGDRQPGQLSAPEAGRATLWAFGFLAVAAVAGLGGLVPSLLTPPPTPPPHLVYAASDGLPTTLVAGRTYFPTYQATTPHNWPKGQTGLDVMLELPNGSQQIECAQSFQTVSRQTITMRCPLHAAAGGPVVVHFGQNLAFRFVLSRGAASAPSEVVFRHTVVAR